MLQAPVSGDPPYLCLLLSIYYESLTTSLNDYLYKSPSKSPSKPSSKPSAKPSPRSSSKPSSKPQSTEKLFTANELKEYNGVTKPELYLAILGSVFDVTRSGKQYGTGGTYNVFVGRDASRSFITGKFVASDASNDVMGLSKTELLTVDNWLNFYKREYKKVGKLIGRYYDSNGLETKYHKDIRTMISQAFAEKAYESIEKYEFPPCNTEWDMKHGTKVWCTKQSGGIERTWVGFPRKLYEPGSDSFRCACIRKEDLSLGNVREYEGCSSNLDSCYIKDA